MSYLTEYEEIDSRYGAFGGDPRGGKITGKGKIRTGKLDFKDVYFVKKLKFNLFSVSQMYDKKNIVLFTDTEYVVLSPNFKLLDENQVLLRVPSKDYIYSVDLRMLFLQEKGKQHKAFCKTKPAEAVNTACYVQNRVLIIKPYNKTPYELLLGKFDGKADEGFFVGYFTQSKAFRVFNRRTKIIEETLHIIFLENKPIVVGSGPSWIFDINTLSESMNYKPVVAGNQPNGNACTKENFDAGQAGKKTVPDQEYIRLPLWTQDSLMSPDDSFKPSGEEVKEVVESPGKDVPRQESQEKDATINITNNNTNNPTVVSSNVHVDGLKDNVVDEDIVYGCTDDPKMPPLEEISIFEDSREAVFGAEADYTNLESTYQVSPIPTTRVHKDHPVEQIIGDL
nr:ribonuclease H-like domain-containing protein [Tanacetum cinerariifolium]